MKNETATNRVGRELHCAAISHQPHPHASLTPGMCPIVGPIAQSRSLTPANRFSIFVLCGCLLGGCFKDETTQQPGGSESPRAVNVPVEYRSPGDSALSAASVTDETFLCSYFLRGGRVIFRVNSDFAMDPEMQEHIDNLPRPADCLEGGGDPRPRSTGRTSANP